MNDKIRLVYLDEDEGWQSQAHSVLKNDFQLLIPPYMPHNIEDIWLEICEFDAQAVLIDYRLNNTGVVSYTGDDVIRVLHRHYQQNLLQRIHGHCSHLLKSFYSLHLKRGMQIWNLLQNY